MRTTNKIIKQALDFGFDFELININNIENEIVDFFNDNIDKIEQLEDECEILRNRNSQSVIYKDYCCSGEIVDFSEHWHKPTETKIYHSKFIIEDDEIVKAMNLYYIVGITDYNQ